MKRKPFRPNYQKGTSKKHCGNCYHGHYSQCGYKDRRMLQCLDLKRYNYEHRKEGAGTVGAKNVCDVWKPKQAS